MGIEREKGGNNSPSLLRTELRQEGRGICQTLLTTTSFVIYCEGLSFCHSARQRDHFTSCFLLYYYWLRWKATSLALTSLKPWTHNMELLPRVPFPWITFHKQQQFNVTKTEFIIFFFQNLLFFLNLPFQSTQDKNLIPPDASPPFKMKESKLSPRQLLLVGVLFIPSATGFQFRPSHLASEPLRYPLSKCPRFSSSCLPPTESAPEHRTEGCFQDANLIRLHPRALGWLDTVL